ncbi:putative reverse transcriptase domain-containing protein [Tanacetum coccineum]
MRVNIPDFDGNYLSPEGFINWLVTVEEVFKFKDVPENKRVSFITTKLRGRASAWWQQLKLTRERVGKPRVTSWRKMKKLLREKFIRHNYQRLMYQRLQILKQGTKSVEDYTTEFYQLIARNDIQETDDQLVSRYIGGSSGLGNVTSRFVPNQTKVGGGNTGPVSKGVGSSGLKCFNCGEPGHRQSKCKKARKIHLFVDEEWEDNGVADDDYEEPILFDDYHYEEEISTCTILAFSVGTTYKDNVWCDVVPMDAFHLLLGRPWESDHNTTHNGRANTYSFLFDGVKITLMPNKPKELVNKPTSTLLTLLQFQDELEMGDDVFVLIRKEVAKDSEIPEAMIPLLKEFSNVFHDELPNGLPPLRDIQHHIDLEPSSQLPNRPQYRMSP